MRCRNCGTEIAEKALICFKCGTATTEAVNRPFVIESRPSASFWASIVTLNVLEVVGVYFGITGATPNARMAGWAIFGVATVLVTARILLRRR